MTKVGLETPDYLTYFAKLPCSGFVKTAAKCEDIDECSDKIDQCDRFADCTNNIGSYSCKCHAGYDGSGEINKILYRYLIL